MQDHPGKSPNGKVGPDDEPAGHHGGTEGLTRPQDAGHGPYGARQNADMGFQSDSGRHPERRQDPDGVGDQGAEGGHDPDLRGYGGDGGSQSGYGGYGSGPDSVESGQARRDVGVDPLQSGKQPRAVSGRAGSDGADRSG